MVEPNKSYNQKSKEIIALELKYTNQNPTDFVKWQRSFDRLIKPKLIWDSAGKNTYVRTKHGKIGA